MAAQLFQRVSEHLLNGRLNFGTHTISGILITTDVSDATLNGTGTQSLQESQWISEWSSVIPTMAGNVVDIGAAIVRTGSVFAVTGDSLSADFDHPGVDTIYGVIFFRDSGTTSTSPVLVIEMFDAPIDLTGMILFGYKLPTEGLFDLALTTT